MEVLIANLVSFQQRITTIRIWVIICQISMRQGGSMDKANHKVYNTQKMSRCLSTGILWKWHSQPYLKRYRQIRDVLELDRVRRGIGQAYKILRRFRLRIVGIHRCRIAAEWQEDMNMIRIRVILEKQLLMSKIQIIIIVKSNICGIGIQIRIMDKRLFLKTQAPG